MIELTIRAWFQTLCWGVTLVLASGYAVGAEERPNFLIIMADDLCWRDLGFTGNPDVHTPAIDRLASEGMWLSGMYNASATCSPTRHALYTGLYPIRSGAYPNHTMVDPTTGSLFGHLNEAGYRTALLGKTHIAPASSFPYTYLKRNPDRIDRLHEFILESPDEPWFAVVASNDPHDGWTRGPQDLYVPEQLTVPAYLYDCPETREELRNYYAEITALDEQVAKLQRMLDETRQTESTVVLFLSEQGNTFPRGGKWSLYDNGVHAAAVIRWPNRIEPGSRTEALMQYVDVAPTFLDLAGIDPNRIDTGCPDANGDRGFDGRSFANVLQNPRQSHREVVFGQHTGLGVVGNQNPYPSRSVFDGRYRLIENLAPENVFFARYQHNKASYQALKRDAASVAQARQILERLEHRPRWELYDLSADPYELNNLADDQTLAPKRLELREQMEAWMLQQGDKGLETELKAYERQPKDR